MKELETLGLTKGEVKVYAAILTTGNSPVNMIHEKTGLERRTVYDILNKLIDKGLITYTKEKGVKAYRCAPPERLKEEIKKKKEEIKKFEEKLPLIKDLYASSKPRINLEVFRGKEGLKNIFEDTLNHKECRFIGGGYYVKDLLPDFWNVYNRKRKEKKMKWYNLVRHEFKKRDIPTDQYIHNKFLPKEFSGSPSVILIYGDKIVNLLWDEEYFAFMIESKAIADNYKRYFKFLWENIALKD